MAALRETLDRYENGYKGACYACESVGEANALLEAKLEAMWEALDSLREECTNEDGHPEDYINTLKKADAALLQGDK